MSRIGRKPIPVPAGVKIGLHPGHVDVQGPKGKLIVPLPHGITFEQKDAVLTALRDTEDHRALHGLARALVANAVHGVTLGFKKDLVIVGVGYRAELKGKIVAVTKGQTTAHIRIDIGGGVIVTSSITNEAVDDLALKVGDDAFAVIKASDVFLATND